MLISSLVAGHLPTHPCLVRPEISLSLSFFQHTGKWDNPLMGWSSSADPLGTLKLTFDSEEAAIAYADKMGFKYEVRR